MASDDAQPPRSRQEEIAAEYIAQMYIAAHHVHKELSASGSVSEDKRQTLQTAVADVAFVLHPARREDGINWDAATPFDHAPEFIFDTLFQGEIRESVPEGEHNPTTVRQRGPKRIRAHKLHQMALDLLDVAHKLGVNYETKINREKINPDPI